jgi:hypothetical protein
MRRSRSAHVPELGLVKPGEKFYQVVEPPKKPASQDADGD